MSIGVIIITGAGGGIGRATAIRAAQAGFTPVLVGRTESTLRQTQQMISNSIVVPADVTRPNQVQAVVAETLQRLGRIDGIVNNAGTAPNLPIDQCTVEQWQSIVETNLSAVFYFCKAVWETFVSQRAGVIVNISSIAARDPFAGFVAYGAAKAGVNNLGITLARQGHPVGVRVHTIAPGAVETAMFRQILSPEQWPAENTLAPDDVARVVVQCLTGELRHTSGEVIWLSRRP